MATTKELLKARDAGGNLICAIGTEEGKPVVYDPRNSRDPLPWVVEGTAIRRKSSEVAVSLQEAYERIQEAEAPADPIAILTKRMGTNASRTAEAYLQRHPTEYLPARLTGSQEPATPSAGTLSAPSGQSLLERLLTASGVRHEAIHTEMEGVPITAFKIGGALLTPREAAGLLRKEK
jgi:hypothetical protein